MGEDAKESAVLQGNILVDLYRSNPDGLDLDGNGKVDVYKRQILRCRIWTD